MNSPLVVVCQKCGYDSVPVSRRTVGGKIICPRCSNAQDEPKKEFNILRNKRTEANDFSMEYPCDFCQRFAGQVIELPNPIGSSMDIIDEDTGPREPRICSACLHDMQEAMSKNIRDHFESDFQESRQEV